jgi:hypothetical protein
LSPFFAWGNISAFIGVFPSFKREVQRRPKRWRTRAPLTGNQPCFPPLPLFFTNKPKCLTTMQWMYGLGKTSPSRYEIRPVWLLVLRVRLNAWHAGLVGEKHQQGRERRGV